MDAEKRKFLEKQALEIRKGIVLEIYSAQSGHPGGSLAIADVVSYLYFMEMHVDAQKPEDEKRDRFVLSKGHSVPAVYAALALKGDFPKEWLKEFRKLGSRLQGHPNMRDTPGIDMSTGSLGQGISAACGMALSAKACGDPYRVYTILGDGELEEGQVWEAAMFAAQYKLDNLVAYVDNNGLQIDGKITDVMSPEPITDKYAAFGWHVIEIDGHNFDEIEAAYKEAKTVKGKPTVIVAHSIKGKGISYMENQASWHGKAPNDEEYAQAVKELDAALAKLEAQA
ncbi:MAG TPA: transketolase [Ruminococcaceae bacterium]|nr:transketolase [Oscillospiraceae bacterium]